MLQRTTDYVDEDDDEGEKTWLVQAETAVNESRLSYIITGHCSPSIH